MLYLYEALRFSLNTKYNFIMKIETLIVIMLGDMLITKPSDVSPSYIWESYYRIKNVTVSMNYGRYVESKSRSKVTCLQGRNQSHVISYDDVNHSCRHFLDLNTTLVSGGDQASTSVWVRNNSVMTVFPVERSDGQYVANVDGACKAVGGRSANINSLHDAKISGLHLCRCGLLGDNTTRFSVQEDTSSCTKFTSSLLWPKVVACKLSTGEYLNPANLVYCIFS